MAQFDDFIDRLKVLIREPSVVGAEHSFFRVLQRELEERGASKSDRLPATNAAYWNSFGPVQTRPWRSMWAEK